MYTSIMLCVVRVLHLLRVMLADVFFKVGVFPCWSPRGQGTPSTPALQASATGGVDRRVKKEQGRNERPSLHKKYSQDYVEEAHVCAAVLSPKLRGSRSGAAAFGAWNI